MKTVTQVKRPVKAKEIVKKRVCAYCRISMQTERMNHSLSAQISHYSEVIQANPEWEYAGVYADDGISGTKATREEFKRMLADCELGLIDIVITKSISRFARNTVDLLKTVRRLKELGISVRFEKEGIDSLTADGEVLLTLLASYAQEETYSISQNVTWATRKRMEQGIPNGRFRVYGYYWDEYDLVVNEEQAEVVKRIFQNFLDGKSRLETERELNAEGITTYYGLPWYDSEIKYILTNPIYTGDLVMQKEYVSDPVTGKTKKNRGELPMYVVEDHHKAIIDREVFQFVQEEMARRKEAGCFANKALNLTCFSTKIKCKKCGRSYTHNRKANPATTNSVYGEQVTYWACTSKKEKGPSCESALVPDRVLEKVCSDVLGIPEFKEEVFLEKIDYIVADSDKSLEFHFYDGKTCTVFWKSDAKSKCWNDELKDKQREWVRAAMLKGEGRYYPFTARIKCGGCGASVRRYVRTYKTTDRKQVLWAHSSPSGKSPCCLRRGIPEEELKRLTAEVMEVESFDAKAFMSAVERIEVKDGIELNFYFKDGSIKTIHYDPPRFFTPSEEIDDKGGVR